MAEQTAATGAGMRRYGSLEETFTERRVPIENRAFLKSLMFRVKIAGLFRGDDWVLVVRADGGPNIQIHPGYTDGFATEQEIIDSVGEAIRRPSVRPGGGWAVDHPVRVASKEPAPGRPAAKKRASAPRKAATPATPRTPPQPERQHEVCPNCFILMSLAGICGSCGEAVTG